MDGQEQGGLVRLSGLWKGKTKKGDIMLSGQVSPTMALVVFPANNSGGNGPDYVAYFAPSGKGRSKGGGESTGETL